MYVSHFWPLYFYFSFFKERRTRKAMYTYIPHAAEAAYNWFTSPPPAASIVKVVAMNFLSPPP